MNSRKRLTVMLYSLVLAALLLTGTVFAAYQVLDTDTSSARAAAFDVDAWIEGSGPAEYTLYVSSYSETALSYSVTIELNSALPDGVELYLDNSKVYFSGTVGTIYGGTLSAGYGHQNEHKITFDTVNALDTTEISVDVYVTAEQIN